ncbi:MAG: hypothetical protein IPK12_23685 [Gemmatimonadetes bacterium]|nr:hypothetical protein [Gemmatimonadota bacterium]
MTSVVQALIRVILGLKGLFAARPGMPAGILAAVARLSNFAEAMRALGETQTTGEARSMKAVSRAEEVRRYIWYFIIQPLGLIAADAFSGDRSRKVEFRMTRALHSSKESFRYRARSILTAPSARRRRPCSSTGWIRNCRRCSRPSSTSSPRSLRR